MSIANSRLEQLPKDVLAYAMQFAGNLEASAASKTIQKANYEAFRLLSKQHGIVCSDRPIQADSYTKQWAALCKQNWSNLLFTLTSPKTVRFLTDSGKQAIGCDPKAVDSRTLKLDMNALTATRSEIARLAEKERFLARAMISAVSSICITGGMYGVFHRDKMLPRLGWLCVLTTMSLFDDHFLNCNLFLAFTYLYIGCIDSIPSFSLSRRIACRIIDVIVKRAPFLEPILVSVVRNFAKVERLWANT